MATVFLSLGSNKGHGGEQLLKQALQLLQSVAASSLYKTEPWGNAGNKPFLNMAAKAETKKSPLDFLAFTQSIEKKLGRKKQLGRLQRNESRRLYAPRPIDIDILFYDDLILAEPNLIIPHPLITLRRFVLEPLVEIAPNFIHPVFKKNIMELLNECADKGKVSLLNEYASA